MDVFHRGGGTRTNHNKIEGDCHKKGTLKARVGLKKKRDRKVKKARSECPRAIKEKPKGQSNKEKSCQKKKKEKGKSMGRNFLAGEKGENGGPGPASKSRGGGCSYRARNPKGEKKKGGGHGFSYIKVIRRRRPKGTNNQKNDSARCKANFSLKKARKKVDLERKN